MVYIYLDTSTQALSPFWTGILITVIRAQLQLAQCPFSNIFLYSSKNISAIYFSCKYIDFPLLSLLVSCTWENQTLVLRRYSKRSQSASFSLNVALPLPSAVLLTTLQILISPRHGSTKALVIASLKSPRSPKVHKEQFQVEQHTEAVLTVMPSPFPSAHTSLPPAPSWLFEKVPHQHHCGAQLDHHCYHLKEGFQVYRGQVPLHRYLYGLCCFRHHHHCCHHPITLFVINKIKVGRIGFRGEHSWSSSPQ